MSGGIFVIKDDETLVEMKEQSYDSEILLQKLLEQYPKLMAGDQVNRESPRRWLLVKREMPLTSTGDSTGKWSVDHLFIDQDGIPTIVEVKRSSDTRIRREVVGQMLDYAANAVLNWKVEELRSSFESNCQKNDEDPDEKLREFLLLEDEFSYKTEAEDFWMNVKTNLQAGKVRLLFVADKIPSELARIIEFLNEQMDPAEVLGVEISQYAGEKIKTMVSRVIGQTIEAREKKSVSKAIADTTETQFLSSVDKNGSKVFGQIFEYAKQNNLWFGWGRKGFSLNMNLDNSSVILFFGFPPDSPDKQCVVFSTGLKNVMDELRKKVNNADSIVDAYQQSLKALDYFSETGKSSALKWDINRDFSETEIKQFLDIVKDVISKIKASGLK